MTIDRNHTKTSFFLTLLMILTPFAAASTVTTFADESSEVTIQFKDGINSINNTGAGFYLPNNETIVSASVNVSNEPALFSSDIGVAGINGASDMMAMLGHAWKMPGNARKFQKTLENARKRRNVRKPQKSPKIFK